jgi:hypothetical protein
MQFEEHSQPDGSLRVTLDGKPLACLVCSGDGFHERTSLLNTRGGEFFGFAWANKTATNYICTNCGYVFWFMQ